MFELLKKFGAGTTQRIMGFYESINAKLYREDAEDGIVAFIAKYFGKRKIIENEVSANFSLNFLIIIEIDKLIGL